MVKFFEGLPLFPSRCVLLATRSALSYCARAHAFLVGRGPARFVAADLVDGILHEPLHMEAVEDDLRLGRALGHRLDVRARHVDRDGLELRAPRGAELVEEGLSVSAFLPG